MQTDKRRFYGIQILRGVAALLVLFHHQIQVAGDRIPGAPSPRFLLNGAFGVDLFFPISGFVMFLSASSLLRKKPVGTSLWRQFGWRRIVRVVPLYWLMTCVKLLIFFLIPAAMLHFRLIPSNVVGSFLFIPAFDHNHVPEPVLPVGWTLNYEMLFYLIVTVALALRLSLLRFVSIVIVILAAIGLLVPQFHSHSWGAWTYLADPIELEFLAGLLMAGFLIRVQATPVWLSVVVFFGALCFALLVPTPGLLEFTPLRPLLWGIPGALMVWSVLALDPHWDLARQRVLLLLGDASYSLYLVQGFLMPAVGALAAHLHLHGAPGLVIFFGLSTVATIAVAIVVHLYVELPMLNLLSHGRPSWSLRSNASV
jgi:exopolysaccharide production protein ExoZ